MVVEYAGRLRGHGHDVTLLGPEHYEWLPRLRAGKRIRMLAGYSQATLRAVRERKYDLIELWGAEAWWVTARLARRSRRPVLVARSNGLEPHFEATLLQHRLAAPTTGFGRQFDRWQQQTFAFRRADLLTVVSRFDRDFAIAHGYQPEERLLTLENPLNDDWLGQPFETARPPVIGFFGSATPNKGGALLLSALAPVLERNPQWRARFVGAPELAETSLPTAIAARIEFRPFVADRAALRTLYRETAIMTLPSAYESFGLAAAEAMASGCLLVASKTGFAAGLVSEVEAVLVPERSPAAWTRALQTTTADDFDREAIAGAGQARVQGLRWEPTVRHLTAVYERLCTSRAASLQ